MVKNTEKCNELVARDAEVIAECQHLSYYPLAVREAHGSIITDEDGNQYIDFLSAASSLNLGSSNPIITAAIEEQLKKCTQYSQVYTYSKPTIEYAERLVSVYPGGEKAKVCFGNCGSDGNDAAVKFARAYTGREKIIVFQNGYHGNTYGSTSMTTCSEKMRANIGPLLPEIYVFPFFGTDTPDDVVERECTAEIEETFSGDMSLEEVAAVVIEPVQGDGGILPAHPVFMKKLYDLCKAHGILFISEEVQQGFYRTGKFFGIEHYDIVPDGIIMGKSIGAGLTLGAFMGKAEIMEALPAPAHLFTLGGNALACAAGCAAFDYYQTPEFQEILAANIKLCEELAADLQAKHPQTVGFVRNLGFSMGIGIEKDGEKDDDGTFKILFRAYEKGLLVISLAGNVLRIQPPLNIEPENLRKGFEILDESMTDYENGAISDEVFKYRSGW